MRVPVGPGVESPVETMAASDDFEAFPTSFGIAPSLASQMVADGWQSANFASILSDVSDFDRLNIWEQLFSEEINLVQRSSVKAAWFSLQSSSKGADSLPIFTTISCALSSGRVLHRIISTQDQRFYGE